MDSHSRRKPETANRRSRQIKTVLKIFRRFELRMRSASLKLADLILNSNRLKIFRTVFICLLLLFAVSGFLRLWLSMQSLETPNIYRKDFLQVYLLARAAV